MSITMQDHEKSSLELMHEARLKNPGKPKRPISEKRLEANRRNAAKSTGPRSERGKARVAKNALKHGLCARLSCLPSECEATFDLFLQELEQEFRPRTAMQRIIFNQIANLIWRLERLPEAQTKLFAEETPHAVRTGDAPLTPADVLARRFSADPTRNSFLLMDRYERSMRNSVLRLTRQFEHLKKHHATVPYDDNEPPVPVEMAWDEHKAEAQRRAFAEGRYVAPKPKLATDGEKSVATDGAQMCTDTEEKELATDGHRWAPIRNRRRDWNWKAVALMLPRRARTSGP